MYKIKKDVKVYLYDVVNGYYTHAFPNIDEMLKFIASKYTIEWCDKNFRNTFLENVNMGNDKYYLITRFRNYTDNSGNLQADITYTCYDKQYMFIDEDWRIIDPRIYKSIIEGYRKIRNTNYKNLWNNRKRFRLDIPYEYRKDPVPTIHKLHRTRCYRHPHTINEKRFNAIPEYKEYVRGSRRGFNLPSYYDDLGFSRAKSRSWKDCSKKRKQWM